MKQAAYEARVVEADEGIALEVTTSSGETQVQPVESLENGRFDAQDGAVVWVAL